MESKKIEILIEKYLEGTTSIIEEKELKEYFSSHEVAEHLKIYQSMFGYFGRQKEVQYTKNLPLKPRRQNRVKWMSIAAVLVLFLSGIFYFNREEKQDLGTFTNPEEAIVETQKALKLLSSEVNQGVESVAVLKEYETTRKTIFK